MNSVAGFLKDIKFHHSIFALPFAMSALFFIDLSAFTIYSFLLILVCMFLARSFAMGINRIADKEIDRQNPRTKGRVLASNFDLYQPYIFILAICAVGFCLAAFALSEAAGYFALPVLFFLGAYSYLKRHVIFTHWYLGLCLGLAPIAVAIALDAEVSSSLFIMMFAILFWTAGFDLIYSCQDVEFDAKHKLHSFPQKFGVKNTISVSKLNFVIMILLLVMLGLLNSFGYLYYIGIGLIASLLAWQHILVNDIDVGGRSSNMTQAFFTSNACVGIIFLMFLSLEHIVGRL